MTPACGRCAYFRPWYPEEDLPADGVCSTMLHAILVTLDSGGHCPLFRAVRSEDVRRLATHAARAGYSWTAPQDKTK